jgi:cardiolipin synthase
LRLERWAVWAFVIAAITDFFDGWLARKLHAESVWGAILDPIADKVLVCGALLGLMSLGPQPDGALPAGLILFREFAVSALREVTAGKG